MKIYQGSAQLNKGFHDQLAGTRTRLTQSQNIISINPYVNTTLFFSWSKPDVASPDVYPPVVRAAPAPTPQASGLL